MDIYMIAERLHMSPQQVLEGHTQAEIIGWHLYGNWVEAERDIREREARTRQGLRRGAP